MAGCQTEVVNNAPDPESYAITFKTADTNGTLTAKVGGTAINSGDKVQAGKEVVFTATANEGYKVKDWTVNDKDQNVSEVTYTLKVSKKTAVKVSFAQNLHTVTFNTEGGNGTLKTMSEGGTETATSPINVAHGKTVTLTATPNTDSVVDKWTITPESALQTGGTYGSTTATLKVTEDTSVSVSFKTTYQVSFGVESGLGKLTATVEGAGEINTGDRVAAGRKVTFKAEAGANCAVFKWELNGMPISEAGTNTEYTLTLTDNADVKVFFEATPVDGAAVFILSGKKDITFVLSTEGHESVTVEGCEENSIQANAKVTVHAKGDVVILRGNITELNCEDDQFISLNVKGLTSLQELSCRGSQLKNINVQGCTSLQRLICAQNQIKSIDVQSLTSLQRLECSYNQLSSLDVHGLSGLGYLNCEWNHNITELNVQGCTGLQELKCGQNRITNLDLQGLNALQELSYWGNQLTELKLSGLPALRKLSCVINQLKPLDVSGLPALQELSCWRNNIDEEGMKTLFASLPSRIGKDGGVCKLFRDDDPDNNHKDFCLKQPSKPQKARTGESKNTPNHGHGKICK